MRRLKPDHDYPEVPEGCSPHLLQPPAVPDCSCQLSQEGKRVSKRLTMCACICPACTGSVQRGTRLIDWNQANAPMIVQDVAAWLPMVVEDCHRWMNAQTAPCLKAAAGPESNLVAAQELLYPDYKIRRPGFLSDG